jgi:hypothetical protein
MYGSNRTNATQNDYDLILSKLRTDNALIPFITCEDTIDNMVNRLKYNKFKYEI